ncbi:MAG TPA: 16S rRNA (cytosine(1402)-N(4))-methyltransferase RsmH [Candidatus Uhrbacteria bacterium]|nr:16S rRNA (cytosine(1402)-N(4))-methyltransferase RsmH [Candidatus Uhrbacteria bacterium]
MKFKHQPVLVKEVLQYLSPKANENFIDCTFGAGGHAKEILRLTAPAGKLLGIDLDPEAIKAAKENLKNFRNRIVLVNDNYKNLKEIIYDTGFNKINGILLDLGISSYELQDQTRGFSFKVSAFLDMRFGNGKKTAADVVNHYKEEELAKIFKEYGEERYSRQIAREIVLSRKKNKINTTDQLVSLIEKVYKNKPKPHKIHVATKIFQALRIEVNDELNNLKKILPVSLEILEKEGRLVVISFHSLEDRIVKHFFRQEAKDCICPPESLECRCQHKARLRILTKKVVMAGKEEIISNPRSRSAKLRAALKINV